MTLGDWADNVRYYFEHQPPLTATKMALGQLGAGALRRLTPYFPPPSKLVLEREWEVLIVLDACRPEALQAVADEYDFLPAEIATTYSQASASVEWMQTNFTEDCATEMARTLHVTGNPNSHANLNTNDWHTLDEVWRNGYDAERGLIPPRPITDRAVSRWRSSRADRMLVHYMQPHQPYLGFSPSDEDPAVLRPNAADDRGVFKWLIEGKVTHEEVWDAYLDTLRWVLDDVKLLLSNMEAERVVITADHAELFGEWGLYAHPIRTWVPALLRVPWVEVSASDTNSHTPDTEAAEQKDTAAPNGQLRALGYR